jgi:ABC-type antimicrobial peptide transport system permease subunit
VLAEIRPQFSVVLTGSVLLRTLGAALLMGVLASVVPSRRVATEEPAMVYRER